METTINVKSQKDAASISKAADGTWYFVSGNNNFPGSSRTTHHVSDRVQHVNSGMILTLEPNKRLVYHNPSKGRYFATDGSIIEMTMDETLTALNSDLVPVLSEPNQMTTKNIECNAFGGDENIDEKALCLLTDEQRPPGTLPGGKWFHQSMSKKDVESTQEKKVDDTAAPNVRLIYQDTDGKGVHRYYTQVGNEVSITQVEKLQMVHSSVHVSTSMSAGNTNSTTASAVTSYNNKNSITRGLVMRGPAGSKPGGKWFKQVYKGSKTRNASGVMCCLYGITASTIVSNVPMDERFVYRNPSVSVYDGKYQYFNMAGGVVYPFQGTFHPLPDETFAPLGYYNAEGKVVGVAMPTTSASSRSQQKGGDDEKHHHPPGTAPNGNWYKEQITGGKSRFIYRDIVNEGKWFDANGKLIHPNLSFLQPPFVDYRPHLQSLAELASP